LTMRTSTLICSLLLGGSTLPIVTFGEDLEVTEGEPESAPEHEIEVEEEEVAAVEIPVLTAPSTDSFLFAETFEGADPFGSGAWKKSSDSKYTGQPVSVTVENDAPYAGDHAVLLSAANQHYGFGSKFSAPLDTTDKPFVVQYEVKLLDGMKCGGAYLKLLRDEPELDVATMDNESPYVIMFGPDSCGDTNKVHFILQHQNPVSLEWEEKHATTPPSPKKDKHSHVYTLAINTDNSFEIFVDLESKSKGSLLEDMKPAVNPPAEIDDPTDSKPSDWVDTKKIKDPEASKPDDWDEDAPKKIPDASAEKPKDWLDSEPDFVPDPDAAVPDDWDEEEDGEWEAPMVSNPKCASVSGCGEWKRPEIENPEYKGKWSAPMIDNPEYKGPWKAKQIPNPNFFEDKAPHNMAKIGAVAVEIWTTSGDIRMDNFIIGDSLSDAQAFAKATWKVKADLEAASEKNKMKDDNKSKRSEMRAEGGLQNKVMAYIGDVSDLAVENPIPAVVTLIVIIFSLILLCTGGGPLNSTPTLRSAQKAEVDEKTPTPSEKKKRTPRAD